MKLIALVAMTAAFTLSSAPVEAAPLLFTLTGDLDAQFELDSSPAPDFPIDGYLTVFIGLSGFPNAPSGVADVGFYNANASGGMLVLDALTGDTLLDTLGPQIYYGPESAPTFQPGIFALTGNSTPGTFTLTITSAPSVPEPASWALMLGGLMLAGAALRRRTEVRYRIA